MSGAYVGTWQLISPKPLSPQQIALARKLVGTMLDAGVPQRQWSLEDGSSIHVLLVNGFPKVTFSTATSTGDTSVHLSNLWVPRGLVVYPAWVDAPGGVGLPIITDSNAGPYDHTNLTPGVSRTRWTPGGPCGEVLVSPDRDAGYAISHRDIAVPLLYHPTKGPVFRWGGKGTFDSRPPDGAWTAYRLELAPFVANYGDESEGNCRALFEGINTVRSGAGQHVLTLLPRGLYRPGKVMVSIMQAAGSTDATATGYPPTYTTEADRLTKDGYSATLMGVSSTSWARGDHPTGFELRALGGAASDVLTGWQAVPGEQAVLVRDVGPAAFGDVGFRGGYWAADVIERTRWIEAGNMHWQSHDLSLPPVSWHGFASINMAWETYPATYDPDNYLTAPLIPLRSFTTATGDVWLNYPRKSSPTAADLEPALSRYIYMRGRAVALAPRGGLVWGSCIASMPATTTRAAMDRLIALVHHPEDQPADYTHEGFTRTLRVWWCDIPRRDHFRAMPQQTICGEDPADAWSWHGGQAIDLGVMPAPTTGFVASAGVNSLKYASAWRFSPDGLHAICLRDYGAFVDYATLGANGVGGIWSASINPRAVELHFALTENSTDTNTTWHGYTAGLTAEDRLIVDGHLPDTDDVFDLPMYELGAVPIAVDYTTDGRVLYAFSAPAVSHQMVTYYPPDGGVGVSMRVQYSYVGIGGAGTQYASDLQYRRLHGARFQTPSTSAYHELAIVLDVPSAAFALKVTQPRYTLDPPNAMASVRLTPRPCQTFTGAGVDGVRLCRAGVLLHEDWYPSPDGALFTVNDPCYTSLADQNTRRVYLPLAASAHVQGFYAERFNQRVLGYQAAPIPGAAPVLAHAPASTACGCTITSADLAGASWPAFDPAPRGGRWVSSVPMPQNDWLIYGKVV